MPERRSRNENIRKLSIAGGTNKSFVLPREVSDLLGRAGVEYIRISITDEGILLTPYWGEDPDDIPEWAKPHA